MPSRATTQKGSRNNATQAKTRILPALWNLGRTEKEIKKGDLTRRIVRAREKTRDYQATFEQLEKDQAIAIVKNKFSLSTPKGLEVLDEGLKSTNFRFETSVGATKTANALLKWFHSRAW